MPKAIIHILGKDAQIEGDFPLEPVVDVTSFYQQNYQFMPKYKQGRWDGRIRLFRKFHRKFPSGLVDIVADTLREIGCTVTIDDQRRSPAIPPFTKKITLHGVSFDYPYDFQLDCMETMVSKKRGVISVATNGGKCLGEGTLVLKHGGSLVPVEHVCKRDLLMGPDGQPRIVKSTTRGVGQLYRIIPEYGVPWVCNDAHILTLFDDHYRKLVDMQLIDYLKLEKNRKKEFFLVSVPVTPIGKESFPIDPYFLGVFLASKDRSVGNVKFTISHLDILKSLQVLHENYDLTFKIPEKTSGDYLISILEWGSKGRILSAELTEQLGPLMAIPSLGKLHSIKQRIAFLSGWIDEAGECCDEGFLIQVKRKDYFERLVLIIKSLGFKIKIRDETFEGRSRFLITVIGNFKDLTLAVPKKANHAEKFRQYDLMSAFRVEEIGEGHFYGFTLSGADGRFLLGDCTVTHNTEIACLVAACLRLPTLFLVPGLELLYQTQRRFMDRFNIDEKSIGIIGDGKWKPGKWVTVSTAATLSKKLETDQCLNFLNSIDLLFNDECHRTASDTFYEVLRACDAYYRFGMSGTPLKRSDGADLKLIAATGSVIYEIKNKFLIERGISSNVEIQLLKIEKPVIPTKTKWPEVYRLGIVENMYRNRALCSVAAKFVEDGKSILMLVKEIDHGNEIDKRLWSYKPTAYIPHQFICGQEPTDIRSKAIQDFKERTLRVLIATAILDEGIDIPNIDVLILCGGGKSTIKTLQRVGRGIRKGGQSDTLIVIDTVDLHHRYLAEHSYQRFQDYKGEDCFKITEIKQQ